MTKNQKLEWATLGLVILSFFALMWVSVKNLDLFGSKPADPGVIIAIIFFFIFCGIFAVNYIIKTILALVRKTEGVLIPCIWVFAPAAAVILTVFLANGAGNFNKEFVFINIISIVFAAVEIILLNWYFAVFYGKDKVMLITMILYNTVCPLAAVCGGLGINYMHNYYVGWFLPAIFVGYAELAVRNHLQNKQQA